jgi:hypothetical protein
MALYTYPQRNLWPVVGIHLEPLSHGFLITPEGRFDDRRLDSPELGALIFGLFHLVVLGLVKVLYLNLTSIDSIEEFFAIRL